MVGPRKFVSPLTLAQRVPQSSQLCTPSKRKLEIDGDDDSENVPPNSSILYSVKLKKPFKIPTLNSESGNKNDVVFKNGSTLGARKRNVLHAGPAHDPEAEGAIVLYEPPEQSATEQLLSLNAKKRLVPVVVDPVLGRVLRPHQIEGVRFLYDCTTGRKSPEAFGCIMADEMGLGKTLQCIALLWTLLKQSEEAGKPTVEKAIIVCPSSLVRNWANELKKWLGENRIRPMTCDNKTSKEQTIKNLEQFACAKGRSVVYPVLIISYESLRGYSNVIKNSQIGLILCDEGHRLKNAESQTYIALNGLNAQRRVILSGTPIQNDLTEYFSLINFAIPNILGSNSEFRKHFELPILRGRDADATDSEKQVSEEKLRELFGIANKFIIRRTADLLTKYLPVKYEHVVFVQLTEAQLKIYKHCADLQVRALGNEHSSQPGGSQPLKAITHLKKLCNHPCLLDRSELPSAVVSDDLDYRTFQTKYSGKLAVLERYLTAMRKETDDKIVLISNYTQTLDMFQKLCEAKLWGCLRLDGTMTTQKRQKLVDQFNDPSHSAFVFLLSSKAGGCGLNLIGANRLILFDPDWNPANDGQALARVWRDGQKKTCFIYRFIATGSIEEKIFQRQAHKQSLSNCVVDEAEDVERHFSRDALRKLFEFNDNTLCDTHDTFKCRRCIKGIQAIKPPAEVLGAGTVSAGAAATDTSNWGHYSKMELGKVYDPVIRACAEQTGRITYVFQNKSHY
ncbi:SNF2 family N-terminal domain-containing protein [Cladochytrium replicatum]|nr:SNF2 family N-terminal domain-containing protein [Cladochytrium replicatum]